MPKNALTLTYRETWELMGISSDTFFRMKKRGVFRKLEAPVPERFSREKVEAWLAGRSLTTQVSI